MASKPWTWVTAAALLFAGLSNVHAHIHYCFDGQADPAAVHLVDGGDHAHGHASHDSHGAGHDGHGQHDGHDDRTSHDDVDVDVPNPALAKAVKHDLPTIAPALSWAEPFTAAPTTALAFTADLPPAPDPAYDHPPLRGPPA